MTTTITINPPCALINANSRHHHHAKARLTKAWREAGRLAAIDAHDPTYFVPVHIVITYRFPTNHRREVQNLQPTSKAICDGLVDAGVIADDSDEWVVGPDNRRDRPNGPLRVTVTIEEI